MCGGVKMFNWEELKENNTLEDFYNVLGEDEKTKPKAYIGETENFKERVKDHDS